MIEQNYQGYLLAAHPKRHDPILSKGVVLIMDHDSHGAIGLQINKIFDNDISFETVMSNVGLSCDYDRPLYSGGVLMTNRINVIHSLDWYSRHTTKLSNNLGISHDVSVLAAISKNEGPEYFRVVAGYHKWLPGTLEGEILGEEPWDVTHTWGFVPATIENVFELDGLEQWHSVIAESSRLQVDNWF
jgi:putative transcriptional regulator